MIRAWMIDCKGEQVIKTFESEEEAEQFADNHGLEIWKVQGTIKSNGESSR